MDNKIIIKIDPILGITKLKPGDFRLSPKIFDIFL